MTFEVVRLIHANHPSLPGHFPGTPLVPGVVIIDEVVAALNEWRQNSELSGIRNIKFLAPLKPEQLFTISFSVTSMNNSEVSFRCRVEERVIVEGRLAVVWGAE
jgi:3-hydroxymyristoyl/3-hydroxydecanoyl-(acyl carrier protein) dehydratase